MARKRHFTLWVSIMLVALTACGDTPAQSMEPVSQEPSISIEEYKSMVSDLNDKIINEVLILATAGEYEHSYWKAHNNISKTVPFGELDFDTMVEDTMEWVAKNSDSSAETIESAYHVLIADYAIVADANVDGEAPGDLSTCVDGLFGAYHQLYTAVTRPSGDIEDFRTILDDSTDAAIAFSARIAHELKT